MKLFEMLREMRPGHWVKNTVVFSALLFAGKISDGTLLLKTVAGFGLFCLSASAMYLVNDLFDVDVDRLNPQNQNRPYALGKINRANMAVTASALSAASILTAFVLDTEFGVVLGIYLVLMTGYSAGLKKIYLLDVVVIATGILLRAIGGALLIHVAISHWFVICILLASLLAGLGKRYSEINVRPEVAKRRRPAYNKKFLKMAMAVLAVLTVLVYGMYTISPRTVDNVGSRNLIITLPIVLAGIIRYLYLVLYQGRGGEPYKLMFTDKILRYMIPAWVLCCAWVIY